MNRLLRPSASSGCAKMAFAMLIAANQDSVFARLAAAMGRPGLAQDPRYATYSARGRAMEELDPLI